MPFVATWVDLGIIILTEVSHTKRHIICYHLNVKTKKKKMIQMKLFTKQKLTQTQITMYVNGAGGRWRGGIKQEDEIDI